MPGPGSRPMQSVSFGHLHLQNFFKAPPVNESSMQSGPRITGQGPQLSMFVNVERNIPETKRVAGAWKIPQSPCAVSWAQECVWERQGARPCLFVIFPNSASSHGPLPPAGGSAAWHTGPAPNCRHTGLSHGPLALLFPLLGMPCRSVFVHLARSSCSFQRASSQVISSLEPALAPTAEPVTPILQQLMAKTPRWQFAPLRG